MKVFSNKRSENSWGFKYLKVFLCVKNCTQFSMTVELGVLLSYLDLVL